MTKTTRTIIRLFSSSGSGHFYSTVKNKRNNPQKITLKKFDPIIRQHVQYVENTRHK